MRNTTLKAAVLASLLAGLLLQACVYPSLAPANTPEPMKLRVVLRPYLGFAPLFIAVEEGYLAEQGFEVEFIEFKRSTEAIPALINGDLDVTGPAVTTGFLNAIVRDGGIKFVAGKGRIEADASCTYWGLVTRKELLDSGELASPADLEGRRISLSDTSVDGYFVTKILEKANLTLDDIEIRDVPTASKPEALKSGSIDLTAMYEPWITRSIHSVDAVVWKGAESEIPGFDSSVIAFGPSLLEENPDAGRRFMVAYLKALRQYEQGKTERNLDILVKYTELERELLEEACWPTFPSDGDIQVDPILDFQRWALDRGLLDELVPADQFWDPSFIEYANQVLNESKP